MGTINALGMAQAMEDGMIELRQALAWHLQSNHYPAVPLNMVDPCVVAIRWVTEGEHDSNVSLPDGILWRGQPVAPAWAIVDAYHLESFIDINEEEWGF
jgi:hypothetical protein